ncbi:hypothetical protein [Actinoplanes sp. DH11]|uniref:5'-methylthioadenosine/S-adenosylhomocysteine nucleosidase family protein n=1 Tax=Actinoplanes sp. DH11 TaxID=2857011 RepID=UPI001E5383F1|nr:hypothetical protein [Actinoplanes sp. DH11]
MTSYHSGVDAGSGNVFHGPVSGRDSYVTEAAPGPDPAGPAGDRADVGILTVLEQEMRAVVEVLRGLAGFGTAQSSGGPTVYQAHMPARHGGTVRIAAVQTLTPGTESAALAHRALVEAYRPAVVLLVGIAGGIGRDVRPCDVVVSDLVISHDARKETADGIRRRGQAQAIAAPLGHRLNEFFTAEGRELAGPGDVPFRVHRGPIGSGNAVLDDKDSPLRAYLSGFNDKVLAVETEAAGVAEAFRQHADAATNPFGWLTVRGLSDLADGAKPADDRFHERASRHAAATVRAMLPYLRFDRSS